MPLWNKNFSVIELRREQGNRSKLHKTALEGQSYLVRILDPGEAFDREKRGIRTNKDMRNMIKVRAAESMPDSLILMNLHHQTQ